MPLTPCRYRARRQSWPCLWNCNYEQAINNRLSGAQVSRLIAHAHLFLVKNGLIANGSFPSVAGRSVSHYVLSMNRHVFTALAIVLVVHVFAAAALARAEAPPQAQRHVDGRVDDNVENLLDRLAKAGDDLETRHIANAILNRWARANSDTIDLLAARAQVAEAAGAASLARQLLDYVVSLAPNWVDGYVRRARVRAATGDDPGALSDLEAALLREPRRFDALAMQGALAERSGDKSRALAAIRKALALQPMNEDLRKSEERLKTDVEGRDI
jgi:tetratricopeptide (TPR) repeat protein